MKKTFNYFSSLVLIYFLFGGIMFLAGSGANLRGVAPVLSAPIKFTVNSIKTIVTDGISNGHLYEPINIFNNIDTSIYLINTVKNDGKNVIEEINLKNDSRKSLVIIGDELRKRNNRQRFLCFFDAPSNSIVAISNQVGTMACYSYNDGSLKWSIDTKDSITFHHRITVQTGKVYVNIRKPDTINNTLLRNEGYAVLDVNNGEINKTWWINDHLTELGDIVKYEGSELLKNDTYQKKTAEYFDFWHINDVVKFDFPTQEGEFLKNGDVLLSLRNLNCFIVIRDDKIKQVFQGEFYKQHDIDIIDGNTVSIFNNNSSDISYPWKKRFNSNVIFKNLKTNKDSILHENIGLDTYSEGQFQQQNQFVMIENQNKHELLILENDSLIWRGGISNSSDSSKINLLNWTQFYFK